MSLVLIPFPFAPLANVLRELVPCLSLEHFLEPSLDIHYLELIKREDGKRGKGGIWEHYLYEPPHETTSKLNPLSTNLERAITSYYLAIVASQNL